MSKLIHTVLVDLNGVAEDLDKFAADPSIIFEDMKGPVIGALADNAVEKLYLTAWQEFHAAGRTPLVVHYPEFWKSVYERVRGTRMAYEDIQTLYRCYLDNYTRRISLFPDFGRFVQR